MPLTLGPLGAFFVSGAAQAARFSACNTGRLAPCRYKVSGFGRWGRVSTDASACDRLGNLEIMQAMKSQVQELLRTALSLPDADRAEIAGSLIQSLDSQADDDVESAWSVEIKRRLEAIDSGSVALISWDDVMGELLRAGDA